MKSISYILESECVRKNKEERQYLFMKIDGSNLSDMFHQSVLLNIPILPILTGTFAHKSERPLSV